MQSIAGDRYTAPLIRRMVPDHTPEARYSSWLLDYLAQGREVYRVGFELRVATPLCRPPRASTEITLQDLQSYRENYQSGTTDGSEVSLNYDLKQVAPDEAPLLGIGPLALEIFDKRRLRSLFRNSVTSTSTAQAMEEHREFLQWYHTPSPSSSDEDEPSSQDFANSYLVFEQVPPSSPLQTWS